MLVGIISDVHANLPALQSVLDRLEKCDEIYCCGDVVGYYPYPNEVVELFKNYDIHSVLGNHDFAVLTNDFSGFNTIAEVAGMWTVENLSEKSYDFLSELPFSIKTEIFSIYHARPGEGLEVLFDYLFPEEVFEPEVSTAVGHTHLQFVKWFGEKFLLNPGSVGQPRDGDSRAAYAILNTENTKISLERTKYDIDEVCEALEKENLPEFLCERLYMGF